VRALKILPPGVPPKPAHHEDRPEPAPAAPAAPPPPVRTRETAHPGYRATLDAVRNNRPSPGRPDNPYVEEAIARQEAALRRSRPPETEHRDAQWEVDRLTGPALDPVEASLQAARRRARMERANGPMPARRASDVA
ncbi:DUF721 domain-containing protein, partial [Streptomyces sp. NPDC008150]